MKSTSIKPKKSYKHFIGIDISRDKLDFAVMERTNFLFHREITNTPEDITGFIRELKQNPSFSTAKAFFCMEDTGYYTNHAIAVFKKMKLNFVVENALRIKNSLGLIRGKYDKIDSIRIGQYAQRNHRELNCWVPCRPVMTQLKLLSTLRDRLLNLKVILKTTLQEQKPFIEKNSHAMAEKCCIRSLDAVVLDLDSINVRIRELIEGDTHLNSLLKLITSVPAVGNITATQIIICTNEFRDISDPKKFASYAGVAPFKKESGKIIRPGKVSHFANKKMKRLLHMCAMVSLQKSGELKKYFDRKTKEDGKSGMSVMNAIRNKLILRIFACVNQQRFYEKDRNVIKECPEEIGEQS